MERVKRLNIIRKCLLNLTCSSPNRIRQKTIIAKGDSGASAHYIRPEDSAILNNYESLNGPIVQQPDNTNLRSTGSGQLPLSKKLTKKAQEAYVLPNLKSASLIALGQLCDDDCKVILSKDSLNVVKNNKIILTGHRNRRDDLWDIPITKTTLSEDKYQHRSVPTLNGATKAPPRRHRTNLVRDVNHISRQECAHHINRQLQQDCKHESTYTATALDKEHKLSIIIRKKQTQHDLVRYLHAACFAPVPSTWTKAIRNNNFITWPGLTVDLVNRHLPPSIATVRGHVHRERKHLQSSKTQVIKREVRLKKENKENIKDKNNITQDVRYGNDQEAEEEDNFPTSPSPNHKTNKVAYVLIDRDEINTAYHDLTGRFPIRSASGNEYIMVAYHYDANCILGHPVRDRTAASLKKAWEHLHLEFEKAGTAPETWVMDNEISAELKKAFVKYDVNFQLVPPRSHRRNLAERAIQTWKNHFKAGIASADPKFPISEWDRLIPQANITLNLLRNARTNPKLSAYVYIYGQFNFAATPLAPPGTKIVAHIDPTDRGTWELNGEVGWYVGPAMDHYRCITAYFPRTRTTRVCDTVTFFPHDVAFPRVTLKDQLIQAAEDIVNILASPPAPTVPTLKAGDPVRNAMIDIAEHLSSMEDIPNHLEDAQLARVHKTKLNPEVVHTPLSLLQEHSTDPKRIRFRNTPTHQYNLRKRTRLPSLGTNFRSLAVQQLKAEEMFTMRVNHIYRPDGKKETIDSLLQGSDRVIWTRSLSNEWGRLAQGNDNNVAYTDTIDFIHQHEVPANRDITYATFVLDYRPLKSEPHRVRITVGGDKLTYLADAGSPAANMLETKILINSTISDAKRGARFMSADLKDFFLATPMEADEYMKVHYKHFPDDIRKRYKLDEKVTKYGHIIIKIKKGMYGLKQAAILAYENLKRNLAPQGYRPIVGTTGMWEHETRPTKFCVCVDDFGIKYFSKDDAQHLMDCLGQNYKYTTDWKGKNYCGLTMEWNYEDGYVDVSMPGYVPSSLQRLQHVPEKVPQYSPHVHTPIKYGMKGSRQYANAPDETPLLSPTETKHIQSVTGSFLFYGRAIDYTALPALNEIASAQAKPRETTKRKAQQLMDYMHTYPDAFLRFYASDMILHIESDAAYLVAPKARSRIAGYFHLSDHPNKTKSPKLNAAIQVECKTLRHVVSSSAEAEVAGIFHNATIAVPMRHILKSIGHPQPPTPIKTDNATATGFVYDNIHQKRSKSWDMRYHWLRDRETQQQFHIFWRPGDENNSDYYTKHHATNHHRATRPKHVRDRGSE